jgi:hypothetical protein
MHGQAVRKRRLDHQRMSAKPFRDGIEGKQHASAACGSAPGILKEGGLKSSRQSRFEPALATGGGARSPFGAPGERAASHSEPSLTCHGRFSSFGTVKSAFAHRARAIDDPDVRCAETCIDQHRVAAVRASSPPSEAIERVAERFSALSDPTRVRLLHALSRAGKLSYYSLADAWVRAALETALAEMPEDRG